MQVMCKARGRAALAEQFHGSECYPDSQQPVCKPCDTSARAAQRYHANMDRVRALKEAPCSQCGRRSDPDAMRLVRDGKALSSYVVMVSSRERLDAELARCVLLCLLCRKAQ